MTTPQTLQRRVAAISVPLVLALSLSACGGSDASSAPDDASSEDFCKIFLDQSEQPSTSDDPEAALDSAKKLTENLIEVGTPAEISGEAREGFEILVDYVSNLDESDAEDFANAGEASEVFGDDDAKKVDAFTSEAVQSCIGDLGDDLGGDLGDLEGELPSDSPS